VPHLPSPLSKVTAAVGAEHEVEAECSATHLKEPLSTALAKEPTRESVGAEVVRAEFGWEANAGDDNHGAHAADSSSVSVQSGERFGCLGPIPAADNASSTDGAP
jgi:hypothetical protein